MKFDLPSLPIRPILSELKQNLAAHRSVVLAAEPGSGKTTVAPLALLDEPWLDGRKIVILEPRRLAVRMAAKRMSDIAHDTVGGLVGYRIRFESKVGPATRIEVVTEGILTRMMQQDPALAGVGLVIFDEFHERTLTADLALALCRDVQTLRSDLRILVMSATMDTSRVAELLDQAPVVVGRGRCFQVSVNYLPRPATEPLVPRTVRAIGRAMAEYEGDILVFLPGAGEIQAVGKQLDEEVLCLPLYGNLPQKQQDLIFARTDRRRVILATPIAETSLTIEGIFVVIDSGLVKIPRFSPATGLTTLHAVSISKASAEQRAGRAGRLGPGVCCRLWTEGEHHSLPEHLPPQIIGADLAPLLLEILQWGANDPGELAWLDPPREGAVNQARELLAQLGAVDVKGALTPEGRQIASLPLHPRLAIMLLHGREMGCGPLACRLAALLQNRDLFRGHDAGRSADIEDRLEILHLFEEEGAAAVRMRDADPALCPRILKEERQYKRLLKITGEIDSFEETGNLLALAYPDRLARRRPGSDQHLLATGRGVLLPAGDHLHQAEFLVAAHVDGGKKQGRIFLAAPLSRDEIIANHAHLLTRQAQVTWNGSQVEAAVLVTLGSIELSREPLPDVDPDTVRHCLLAALQQMGLACLGWGKKSRELQARMQTAHILDPDTWPDVSDEGLLEDLSWLEPWLDGVTTLKQLQAIDPFPILQSLLSWEEQQELDRLAPTHFKVPSGSRIRLKYQPGQAPVLAVRLQEMFGATTTPAIFGGMVPLLVHLLSPAGRPIQITDDLAGFWRNTYHEVKKELKGRYPKHYWPDDPLTAAPTSRTRPKKKPK